MNKIFTSLILTCIVFQCGFAQFAIISDKDGFVNVRTSAKVGNNVFDKLKNGFIIYYFETNGNWINIDYKKNGKELNGYIYNDRVQFVSDFSKIPQISITKDKVILGNNKVRIEIEETKFIKENHRLTFLNKNNTILTKIDNSLFFGADGNIPKNQYKSIKIKINNKNVELPKGALRNIYEPNLDSHRANYDEKNDVLYIYALNSDGSAGYQVIWVIDKKKYRERIEAFGL